jgi:pyridoxamine 5'-phosphate oxidase
MTPEELGPDPITAFVAWFEGARKEPKITMHDSAALATSTPDGKPSVRFVLVRPTSVADPFVFFTNYESRKADEIAANPRGALAIHWEPIGRQVRVEGAVEKISDALSDAYFYSRARGSQIAAWASRQSRLSIADEREDLDRRWAEAEKLYEGREVKRPPHWGGYRIVPEVIEFWQSRPNRLHDRARFERTTDGTWHVTRLDP